tara:strand:+ start:412 stop:735 length:324 start_codon:yes stop_codon:yes gene_type:complete
LFFVAFLKGYYGYALGKNKQPAHAEIEKLKVRAWSRLSWWSLLFFSLCFSANATEKQQQQQQKKKQNNNKTKKNKQTTTQYTCFPTTVFASSSSSLPLPTSLSLSIA